MEVVDNGLDVDFDRASEFVRGIVGRLSNDDLLYFYARFKQAKEGPNNAPKPGFFDFQGKQKWQAWTDMKNMSPARAKQEYVERLDILESGWREREPTPLEKGWISVSTLAKPEETVPDEEKTATDWLKEGNNERFAMAIKGASVEAIDALDKKSGLAMLHWASDRGNEEIVNLLLGCGANVSVTDSEGQTALHYAASCGHTEVVQTLLKAGIDVSVRDGDGLSALDVASDDNIRCSITKALPP